MHRSARRQAKVDMSAAARLRIWIRCGTAMMLALIAVGGNIWLASIVRQGFHSSSPANERFGRPNARVPVSEAEPVTVPQIGKPIGFSPSIPPLTIDLELTQVDRNSQAAMFVANVSTPPALLLQIPGRSGQPAVRGAIGEYFLTRYGRGLSLPLRISATYGVGLAYQTRIPLASVVQSVNDNDRALTLRFTLPLQGTSTAFPSDWYELANDVVVWPPTTYALADSAGVGQPSIPLRLTLTAGPAMRGFSTAMVSKPNVDGSFLRLVINTDSATRTLAYATASVPILLAIVGLFLLAYKPRRNRSVLRVQELAVTIVLGVLAVLPIRQVIVPSELHGLTRIDLLLALGVTSSVGVLLLALAAQLAIRRSSSE
jgi:hypothetical protein